MAKVLVNENNLTNIANAIRGKNGTTTTYKPSEMAAAISAIETGGGSGGALPEDAFNITGDCSYRFAYNGWNWFIDTYGNQVTTSNITNGDSMFKESNNLTNIPFELNFIGDNTSNSNNTISAYRMFFSCYKLESIPVISNCKVKQISEVFSTCRRLQYFPDDIESYFNWSYLDSLDSQWGDGQAQSMFNSCYSLRKIPMGLLKHGNKGIRYSGCAFYALGTNCYALDEMIDIPVIYTGTWTGNGFYLFGRECNRVKNITFMMPDGQPYVKNWKSQTIDLTENVGYTKYSSNITEYNSGITSGKQVSDNIGYQLLKNDPDWWTMDVNYSRYNHDSAVATINSLPDTSAYLATAGGTNNIKFTGEAGTLTDGGAINTLTETEIAVATAKGWTCSFV